MAEEVKIEITSTADTKGIDKANDAFGKLQDETAKSQKGASGAGKAFVSMGQKMQAGISAALGPISAVIGAIAFLSKGVDALLGILNRTSENTRQIKADNFAGYVERTADAYDRMTTSIASADKARADLTARQAEAVAAENELERAMLAREQATAMAALNPDDATGRAAVSARFAAREGAMAQRQGQAGIDAEIMAAQAEAEALRRQAAESGSMSNSVARRIPEAIESVSREGSRQLRGREAWSVGTFGLVKSGFNQADVDSAQANADALVERVRELKRMESEATQAAEAAEARAAAARVRKQALTVQGEAVGITTGVDVQQTQSAIAARDRERAEKEAALEAARSRQGGATGQLSDLERNAARESYEMNQASQALDAGRSTHRGRMNGRAAIATLEADLERETAEARDANMALGRAKVGLVKEISELASQIATLEREVKNIRSRASTRRIDIGGA